MYATMTNEKVMRSPAMMQDAITRTYARRETASGGGLIAWLRRRIRRAAVVRQLTVLNDRMLADIGLERWQIGEVADLVTATPEQTRNPAFGRFLRERVIEPAQRAYRRHAAYRELSALDDRLLNDIGITRGDIPFVARAVATAGGSSRDQVPAAGEDKNLISSLRLWNRSRSAAKELNALDDRMLSDIGLLRGDVSVVAKELAQRSLKAPANHNREPKAA